MSTMTIYEFQAVGQFSNNPMQAAYGPIAKQNVSFTGTAGTSVAFNAKTNLIRVNCDGIAAINLSTDATVAVATDPRLPADQTEYFSVLPGSYISAVTRT